MKSALFVDFDNVYSQLGQMQPEAAERFARQPLQWIDWLIRSLALPEPQAEGQARRLLVRRCYLNPNWYQSYRHAFLRAGFEVVDCPPVTSRGKTSTDIHMVLDMIELLEHQTRFDEFIVFSADADFTPVLRKLRRHDRRTTVLAIGFPSAAYQASADLLIDERIFIREALGLRQDSVDAAPACDEPVSADTGATDGMVPIADEDGFAVIREVCALTGAPLLTPVDVQTVLRVLARCLGEQAFELTATAGLVCSRCLESEGLQIRQRDVVFLLRGLQLNGHVFGRGHDDVPTLASRLVNQVVFLCAREQRLLTEGELSHVRRWIEGPAAR